MRVVGAAGLQHYDVGTTTLVDQQGSFPGLERRTHARKANARMSRPYGNCVGSGRAPNVTSTDRRPPAWETMSTLTL